MGRPAIVQMRPASSITSEIRARKQLCSVDTKKERDDRCNDQRHTPPNSDVSEFGAASPASSKSDTRRRAAPEIRARSLDSCTSRRLALRRRPSKWRRPGQAEQRRQPSLPRRTDRCHRCLLARGSHRGGLGDRLGDHHEPRILLEIDRAISTCRFQAHPISRALSLLQSLASQTENLLAQEWQRFSHLWV